MTLEQQVPFCKSTTMQGAGKYIGVSASWIRDGIKRGDIPYIKLGRAVRILFSDLDNLLESRRVSGR
jgi:excisionase family DNA binding protein